jgi:putative restriction endonuclease
MSVLDFSKITAGHTYKRLYLAELWGYQTHFPISRGVITPSSSNQIILFVTKENQAGSTQYENYISDGFLYWEGEEKRGNDNRIVNATVNGDVVLLFYRHKHHTEFIYMGEVKLMSYILKTDRPSTFVYQIISERLSDTKAAAVPEKTDDKPTERNSIILSRIGQGVFRIDLFKLWHTCAVTDVRTPEILRASHIKPWKYSDNKERLDAYNGLLLSPTLDLLFDRGLISFETDGSIIISKRLGKDREKLAVARDMKLRQTFESNQKYLNYHHNKVLLK